MRRAAIVFLAIGAVALCGCAGGLSSLKSPYPQKEMFGIDPGTPNASPATQSASIAGAGVLKIRKLRVAPPYDGASFVYKTGESRFRTDYYNGFVAAPDGLLTGALIRWLSSTSIFTAVVDGGAGIRSQHVLEGNVTALYGDYSDKTAPAAVIEAKFFLLDDSPAGAAIVFEKTYDARVAMKAATADALAQAFGAAYREILAKLSADLASEGKRTTAAAP